MERRSIAMLSAAHVFNDLNQGALPAMLPYLIFAHHLSYQSAAGLVLTTNLFSSVLQPWFGTLSDKPSFKYNLAPIGLALAGTGVALMGAMPDYQALLCAAAVSGVGVAAFHPDAARLANFVSGERKATGMSFFALGGNVGFAIGPLVATLFMLSLGLRGALLLIVPAFTAAFILHKHIARVTASMAARQESQSRGPGQLTKLQSALAEKRDRWAPFTLLTLCIVCRSIVFFGLNTFLPLYWMHHLNQSKAVSGAALTVLLLSSAIGTLLGGRLADSFGEKRVVIVAMALLPGALSLFLAATTVEAATLALLPVGMFLSGTFSVMVVMGQRYLPLRIGLAAGVTMGLAGSVGGLATPILGQLADLHGVHAALTTLVGCAVASLILAILTVAVDQVGESKAAKEQG